MDGRIFFPDFADTDWRALENAPGANTDVVHTQSILADLTRGVSGLPASPEWVGWIVLWSRAWDIVGGLNGLQAHPSLVVRSALERAAGELLLHLHAMSNAAVGGTPVIKGDMTSRTQEVLRAFFVWGIMNDLGQLREFLNPANLDGTFDPRPARDLLKKLGSRADLWQAQFGAIQEVSDQEADLDRRRAEEQGRAQELELQALLNLPTVQTWKQRLENPSRRRNSNARTRFVSLRSLLWGSHDDYARQQMKSAGTAFAYSSYQANSQILHGGTVYRFLSVGSDGFAPALYDGDDVGEQVTNIAETIRLCAVPLEMFREAIMPRQTD